MTRNIISSTSLLQDVSSLIETARQRVSREINSTLLILNWHIGKRINDEILQNERAAYGEQVISYLADELQTKYSRGYNQTSLSRMSKFARLYPEKEIVATLSHQLSWSHIVKLISIEETLKRDFYIQMCCIEGWSVRALTSKINSMLYERTALSKKSEDSIRAEIDRVRVTNTLTADFIFHDPCVLGFLGLREDYSERDLERAILDELTNFIRELGNDFCFVDRQKRMSLMGKDRYLDLLFFHRGLRRLIAIELKIGSFEPSHKGQMEWYLNWLDKHERKPGEGRPLGIILCADKDQDDIEYLELDASGIHVAQYLTELPPKELLEAKLRKAITVAREKHARLTQIAKPD